MGELQEDRFDLEQDASRIIKLVGEDLSRSSWYFPSFDLAEYRVANLGDDRAKVYYPFVVQQDPGFDADNRTTSPNMAYNLPAADATMIDQLWDEASAEDGTDLDHVRRAGNLVSLPQVPDHLPGDRADATTWFNLDAGDADSKQLAYDRSFYARSQELVFVRVARADWEADPFEQQGEILDFSGADADWSIHDPDDIQNEIIAKELEYRTAGDAPIRARDRAEKWVLEESGLFTHIDNRILRMRDFGVKQVDSGTDADGNTIWQRLPHDRGHTVDDDLRYIDPIVLPGSWLSVDSGLEFVVNPSWETRFPKDNVDVVTDTGSASQRVRHQHIREYLYAVVPSPDGGGTGRLVRAFSVNLDDGDGDGTNDSIYRDAPVGSAIGNLISFNSEDDTGFIIDAVLSDHVARVVFDTYRTDTTGTLGIAEVRMRLYMTTDRADRDASVATHYVTEHVFTMRAGNNKRSRDRHQQILGEDRHPIDF